MAKKYSVVTPILHTCKLIKSSPIVLDNRIFVRDISAEHLGAILKKMPNIGSSIRGDSKCILIDCGDQTPNEGNVRNDLLAVSFTVNAFSEEGAIVHDRSYSIGHARTHSVISVHDYQSVAPTDNQLLKLKSSAKPSELSAVFDVVKSALVKEPKFAISLRRFNAALTKSTPDEKVIDLAICLESMFEASSEISFQFSAFNAILSEPEPAKRQEVFRLLKRFYGWRSKIVHGTHSIDLDWYEESWKRLTQLSILSILSKASFLSEQQPSVGHLT